MKHLLNFFLFVLILVLFTACPRKDEVNPDPDPEPQGDPETFTVNSWVNNNMLLYYYWNDKISKNLKPDGFKDPNDFFEEHLYPTEDRWSWIMDDFEEYKKELDGVPVTMGFSPAFGQFQNSDEVFFIVEYVYPGSPADLAGLKRGDIVLQINNTNLDVNNYYSLYSGTSYTVSLGSIDNNTNTIGLNGKKITMTAAVVEADPAIFDSVISVNGKMIGYLVYSDFTGGIDNVYLHNLGKKLGAMKTAGIDELVIDLRYNPGGSIAAAQYFASILAPAATVDANSVLISLKFNAQYQEYLEKEFPDDLGYKFSSNPYNLDLDKVYFLTANGTASASELIITGLDPYMDVVVIGENTHGKYTGASVLYDAQENPEHNWVMVPITMKYANANGYTDFKNGLTPDYEVLDDGLWDAIPFGNTSDPIIAKAVELITGQQPITRTKSAKAALNVEKIVPSQMELKRNLLVPLPKNQGELIAN